jgi:multidrug efflux pump
MTSSSSFGISQITLQFDLSRDIERPRQDVQAAINASGSVLPRNLPYPPVYSKVNPADAPMVTLAITSDTISQRQLSDIADTLLAQRLSELTGVGRVTVQGNIRPAIRIQADLSRLANYGIALEDVRNVIVAANVAGAKGALDGAHQSYTISANDQISAAEAYRSIIIAYRNGAPVLLRDVADVVDGLENNRVGGFYQGMPADRGRHPAPARRQRDRDGAAHQERAAETAALDADRRHAHRGARCHREHPRLGP